MKTALKTVVLLFGVATFAAVGVNPAEAANETATTEFSMVPRHGTLYKEVKRPVDWRVEVKVEAPYPRSPQVLPLKNVRADFPDEMSFNPDPGMPVCPDDKLGPDVNLSFPPDTIISRCPESVLGNGRAEMYLAQVNGPSGPNLKDAVLVVFNGGRNGAGLPVLKVYGYSKGVNTGIFMVGTLRHSVFDVAIPVLPYDSAVGYFDLNIPGSNNPVQNRGGLDRDYVRTTCAHSPWTGGSSFTLGTRDSAGNPTSSDSEIAAAPLVVPCKGATGRAIFSKIKVKGPKKVRRGKKTGFKVLIKNRGTATARGLRIKVTGKGAKGKASVGKLAPGKSKRVRMKVKFKKRGKSKVRFRINSRQAGPRSVFRKIKVR